MAGLDRHARYGALLALIILSCVACASHSIPPFDSVAFLQVYAVRDRVRVIDLRISGEPEPPITRAYGAVDPSSSLRSAEGLWADRELRVIEYYEERLAPVVMIRDWSAMGQPICRLYARDGKKDLLLCHVYLKPGPESCQTSEAETGVMAVEESVDLRGCFRVGLKCSLHGCWTLIVLLPSDLVELSSVIIEKTAGAMSGRCPMWCPEGGHSVRGGG